MTPINHQRMSHPFLGEEDQSVTGTKWRGEGTVVSHPFLGEGGPWGVILSKEGVGGCDESPFPGRGGEPWWVILSKEGVGEPWWVILLKEGVGGPWWVIQRGRVPREAGGSTNHSQGEGVGGRIMLMCRRSAHITTWYSSDTPVERRPLLSSNDCFSMHGRVLHC